MSEYVNRTVCVDKHEIVVDRDDYEGKTGELIDTQILINRIHAKLKPYSKTNEIDYLSIAKEVCDMIEGRE